MSDANDTTAELEQLREALRFLAHDVREGHSSTLALIEMHRACPESMPPKELTQRLELCARRALRRIDDFVTLARARSLSSCAEELDLLDLLFDAVAEAWHASEECGVRLKVVDVPDVAVLHADRSQLRSAVARLVRHALERAHRGSELRCAVREQGARWCIEIDEVRVGVPAVSARAELSIASTDTSHAWAFVELVARRMAGSAAQWDEPGYGIRLRVFLPRA